jgi:hypothetical protein
MITIIKKALVLSALVAGIYLTPSIAKAQVPVYEFQLVTTIESVVPGGLGRSRMISTDMNGQLEEQKLENFFSLVGINFGNVRNNDKMIGEKINSMSAAGFELHDTTSGVYSTETSTGIFITRYFFRKPKK